MQALAWWFVIGAFVALIAHLLYSDDMEWGGISAEDRTVFFVLNMLLWPLSLWFMIHMDGDDG